MPYLFASEGAGGEVGCLVPSEPSGSGGAAFGIERLRALPPAKLIRQRAAAPENDLSHLEYFELCLSAHYLSCATPVPTDVDNQIRKKLWPESLAVETGLAMGELVLLTRTWDFVPVSARFAHGAPGAWETQALDGHLGEWFTVACAAYCALSRNSATVAKELRSRLFEAIRDEVHRHSEIFGSLWRAGDGMGCLLASASVAHNFGDLDRVMEMWELDVGDPLRLQFYKLGVTPYDSDRKLRYLGRLWVAGELYKSAIGGSAMALENHRHFALRKPRALRARPEYLIPLGPFFDAWGTRVAEGLALADGSPSEDTLEVVEALRHGWERLPKTVGYGRALRAFWQRHPDLELGPLDKPARALLEVPREKFEAEWARAALAHMDEIPSRA